LHAKHILCEFFSIHLLLGDSLQGIDLGIYLFIVSV
jgi:hypothetical protein